MPDECLRTEGVGSAGFGAGAPGRGRGDRGGSVRWSNGFTAGTSGSEGRVFGSGRRREESPKENVSLAVGDSVDHKTFGRGKVLEVKGDRIKIRFGGQAGTKNLLMGYAPIRKVE
ncbi:MAG: hypothetical protein JXR33_05160 [Coriobacteriia bacterium]|nr:hypothetical protein [Coriobacteriia bacterium]